MTAVIFQVDEIDLQFFKNAVGQGNMSQVLRNYVKSYNKDNCEDKETKLILEEIAIKKEIQDKEAELRMIQAALRSIDDKKRLEEERINEQRQDFEMRSIKAHLADLV